MTTVTGTGVPAAPQGFAKAQGRPRREDWKALREHAGLSLSELESRTGINRGTLSRIERSHEPLPHQARALFNVFDNLSDSDDRGVHESDSRGNTRGQAPRSPESKSRPAGPARDSGEREADGSSSHRPPSSIELSEWAPGELTEMYGR
jgi:transcriptional regulator with XRE-family HTH domain